MPMQTQRRRRYKVQPIRNPALGSGWLASSPASLPSRKSGYQLYGRLGGLRGLDGTENLATTGIQSSDRPGRSESRYSQHHPCLRVYTSVNTTESRWNPSSNKLESDRPQHDLSATYVIAQQYSSATFVSLRFSVSRGKIRGVFKRCYYLNFFTSLKLRKSEIAWFESALSRGVPVFSS